MHRVNRGAEPSGLKAIRKKLTPRWIQFYGHNVGEKPTDSRWRAFQPDLSSVFFDLCGYCEEFCEGEVDHFRPKSRNPELVYEWSNWVLACHTCNHKKLQKWPIGGYVDPCTKSPSAKPEAYFDFDTKTGQIFPRSGLSPHRRKKASQMIEDLGLNSYFHLKNRVGWLTLVAEVLKSDNATDPDHAILIDYVASREGQLSSITRVLLEEMGYSVNDNH